MDEDRSDPLWRLQYTMPKLPKDQPKRMRLMRLSAEESENSVTRFRQRIGMYARLDSMRRYEPIERLFRTSDRPDD